MSIGISLGNGTVAQMSDVTFITGNPEKAAAFSRYMNMDIPHHATDLDEIQTVDHRELVEHKVHQAYAQLERPVLVEDVFFTYEAWGNLPGPFVKFFVTAENGVENMCRMLDRFENRRAFASCMFGYYDGKKVEFFEGRIDGSIAEHPRGAGGYGFDRVFIPDGFDGKTAAELSEKEYNRYYTTVKPFVKVHDFLQNELQ